MAGDPLAAAALASAAAASAAGAVVVDLSASDADVVVAQQAETALLAQETRDRAA